MILHLLHIFFTDALTFIMSAPRHRPIVSNRPGARFDRSRQSFLISTGK